MYSLRERNQILPEIIGWINGRFSPQLEGWSKHQWGLARESLHRQGLIPYLYAQIVASGYFPEEFCQSLNNSVKFNSARVARFEEDLAQILQQAQRVGIPILLIKGLNLGLHYYQKPDLRVMADIDLVVHPKDVPVMQKLMQALGYKGDKALTFLKPGNETAFYPTEEHPDNPRPVEVHPNLQRSLSTQNTYDLTSYLWENSFPSQMYGAPVHLPKPQPLLVYLATHTMKHLYYQTGRLLQWIDLTKVAEVAVMDAPLAAPNPWWVYPPLKIAARALSSFPVLQNLDLSELEPQLPSGLAKWAKGVTLNQDCGLVIYQDLREIKWVYLNRLVSLWRPQFIYPHWPLPLALGAWGTRGIRWLWRQLKNSMTG